MMSLAAIRPDDWNIALLVHVLGAMVLVGTLVLAASALLLAWRAGSGPLVRLGYRSLLIGALPSWLLMRLGGEWIASEEDLTDARLTWLDIGFGTADTGFLLLLVGTVLTGLATRRAGAAVATEGAPSGFVRTSAVLVSLLLAAYLVAIWAMTAKPV